MDSKKIKAFVIGPIGDRDAQEGSQSKKSYEDAIETFENIIEPACVAMDLEVFRADHIHRSGDVNDQIYRNLRDSPIVIADLTGANPNVMYELGLRHTTGKLTFQIGERDRLPFDVSTIRTILFKRSDAGFVSAKRALVAAIAEGLEHGADLVAATRIWFEIPHEDDSEHSAEEVNEVHESDADEEEPGFLEKLADTESGITEIAATLNRTVSIIEEIGEILQAGALAIQGIAQTGNYSARKLQVANSVAQKLEDPAIRLSMVAKDYRGNFELISPGMEYMLTELAKSNEDIDQAEDFFQAIKALIDGAESSIEPALSFAECLDSSGNATRMMTRVNRAIKNSVISIVDTSRKIVSWKFLVTNIKGS